MTEVQDTLRTEAEKLPPETYWDNAISEAEQRLNELRGLKELRNQNYDRLTRAADAITESDAPETASKGADTNSQQPATPKVATPDTGDSAQAGSANNAGAGAAKEAAGGKPVAVAKTKTS